MKQSLDMIFIVIIYPGELNVMFEDLVWFSSKMMKCRQQSHPEGRNQTREHVTVMQVPQVDSCLEDHGTTCIHTHMYTGCRLSGWYGVVHGGPSSGVEA